MQRKYINIGNVFNWGVVFMKNVEISLVGSGAALNSHHYVVKTGTKVTSTCRKVNCWKHWVFEKSIELHHLSICMHVFHLLPLLSDVWNWTPNTQMGRTFLHCASFAAFSNVKDVTTGAFSCVERSFGFHSRKICSQELSSPRQFVVLIRLEMPQSLSSPTQGTLFSALPDSRSRLRIFWTQRLIVFFKSSKAIGKSFLSRAVEQTSSLFCFMKTIKGLSTLTVGLVMWESRFEFNIR